MANRNFLQIALDCISRGWYVFPCKPAGKAPLTEHGHLDAANDEKTIRVWWEKNPHANVGIACGASNLTVVDCDHGCATLNEATAWMTRSELPATYTVRTGKRREMNGNPVCGLHLYYSGAMSGSEKFDFAGGSGDIQSQGDYVMAAGSIHPDSREEYVVLRDFPIAPLPETIKSLQKQKREHTPGAVSVDAETLENRRQHLHRYIADHDLICRDYEKVEPDGLWIGIACPFEHASGSRGTESSTVVGFFGKGILFKCSHGTCEGAGRDTLFFREEMFNREAEKHGENGDKMDALLDRLVDGHAVEGTSEEGRNAAKDRRFHTAEELRQAAQRKKLNLIDGFLAAYSITALSSFSGHRKTYVLLNITRSLLLGKALFEYFSVSTELTPERVIYIGDDSTMFDIGERIEELGLMPLVDEGKLLIHTMNSEDPIVLKELKAEELKNSVVFIDTLSDFLDKEESKDTKAVRTQCRRFIRDGALAVVAAHHCPQDLKYISPETVLRGHTSLSGFFTTVWFIHNQDGDLTKDAISYVELVKNRENLETIRPFELERGEGCKLQIYTEPGDDCAFRPQNTIVERNQDQTVKGNPKATTERRKRILDAIRENGPMNLTKLRQSVKGDAKAIGDDVKAMVTDGTLKPVDGKFILPEENTTTTTNPC